MVVVTDHPSTSHPTTPPRRLVAAAAIVDDLTAPRLLLAARRSSPPALAGQWEFPGGKVEPGESAEAALHREIAEELGVTLRLGSRLAGPDDGDWPILDGLAMRVWLARLAEGEPTALADHDDLRWLDHAEWLSVPWLAPDVPIVEALRDRHG